MDKIHYEARRGVYKGNPTLEILKNGEPFWEELPGSKRQFIFGVRKALLISACYDYIEKYVDTNGLMCEGMSNIAIKNDERKTDCVINFHTGFKKSNGARVESPYMEIVGTTKISFGLKKAEALLLLKHELKNFVGSH